MMEGSDQPDAEKKTSEQTAITSEQPTISTEPLPSNPQHSEEPLPPLIPVSKNPLNHTDDRMKDKKKKEPMKKKKPPQKRKPAPENPLFLADLIQMGFE